MIDKRELLEKARERNLTLGIIEKDYVLGWILFGLINIKGLIFKGGTALSKIYLPEMCRLSEDLDFVYLDDFTNITRAIDSVFESIEKRSRIVLRLKSKYENPDYLQLKIQYDAVLARNWVKVDVTREAPIDRVRLKHLKRIYSDYPDFKIKVESIEEIAAQKIRSLVERKKCRDFFDVWQLMKIELNQEKLLTLLEQKFYYKGLEFADSSQLFPDDLSETLKNYWRRELGRLVYPVPDMEKTISELNEKWGQVLNLIH